MSGRVPENVFRIHDSVFLDDLPCVIDPVLVFVHVRFQFDAVRKNLRESCEHVVLRENRGRRSVRHRVVERLQEVENVVENVLLPREHRIPKYALGSFEQRRSDALGVLFKHRHERFFAMDS